MRDKSGPTSEIRGQAVRQRVLDAAERLLAQRRADFSMRDLAAEAGVSFATPFNRFGNKAAIMHALSAQRIEAMMARLRAAPAPPIAAEGVRLAVDIASAVMLEKPEVNRTVMGWLGTPGPTSGAVLAHSTSLWALALGQGEGLADGRREEALRALPTQLAFGFRGVLSFWSAGELPDEELGLEARRVAEGLLRGFVG